jgi:predicted negative regulator of RcsB-dependent stress response|tara:strand:- start:322197 stop:322460 length:264 start_codon:yes stop_codon:yes gene_type:complete
MSSSNKTVLAVIVVVAVALAGYYGYQWNQERQGAAFSDEAAELPSGSSTTDSSLEEDAAAIDAELQGLDADNSSAEASLEGSAEAQY